MLKPLYTKQFERDLKVAVKRGKDISKIKNLISMLVNEASLPLKFRNHKLKGNFKFRWECHIEPDWLLIYKLQDGIIIFERTGSHSDLFR